ncbi:ribonuclease HI [Burkholderia ubonensis]|nr:ribonuclease HI [Burkholderia ubonensis]KVP40118.1 ribonuclease HI [Burkholderia ubonensis]
MDEEPAAADTGAGPFVVYTDGGARPSNPGPAGWGAVLLEAGEVKFAAGGFIGVQTNQIAELVAAIEGLSRVPEGARVELVSDSQYTLKGLSEWRAGWERKGWVNSAGQPVANKEYWKRLFALADKRKVTTRWVKGHNGDPLNERCDALATKAIEARAALVFE